MAALAENLYAPPVFQGGINDRCALYNVRNVNTGDTVDVYQMFSAPKTALFLGSTNSAKGICTIAGTVITVTPASLANDAGYLLVWGSAS